MNRLTFGMVTVLAGSAAGAAQVASTPPASYEAVLRLYASGEHEAAVQHLAKFKWKTLDEGFGRFRAQIGRAGHCPECPDTLTEPIRAATMLHLDRDLAENPPQQNVEHTPRCGGRHAQRAMEYAGLLAVRERTRDFARRFYLAMAWRAEWDGCLDQARQWARTGLETFREDPELRLVLGVSYEKAARLGTENRERSLRDARPELSKVVQSAPLHLGAGVHLGRVWWLLGFTDEAQRTLEAVVAKPGDIAPRYLAYTFLGQAYERAGRGEAAVQAYRSALSVLPDGQVAALGLAHALLVQGDTVGAAIAAERALSRKGASPDPHRDYNADNAQGARGLFDALRQESRQ